MRLKIYFLILILLLACNLKAQEKYMISWDYKNLSFKEFVTKLKPASCKFYFKDDWVTGLKLSDYAGCKTLSVSWIISLRELCSIIILMTQECSNYKELYG